MENEQLKLLAQSIAKMEQSQNQINEDYLFSMIQDLSLQDLFELDEMILSELENSKFEK